LVSVKGDIGGYTPAICYLSGKQLAGIGGVIGGL
jgi:hypothetical protein